MQELKYLAGYPETIIGQVKQLLSGDGLGSLLLRRYPLPHDKRTEQSLYAYAMALKNLYLRNSHPISKVIYDSGVHVIRHSLGTHTYVSRVQGTKLKAKNEIRVSTVFRDGPLAFLKMILVHELAHLKEKEHGKAFYQLCEHMEPDYYQLEFDTRLYLTHLDLFGPLYRK